MDTNAMNTNVDDEFMNWIQVWFDLWGGVQTSYTITEPPTTLPTLTVFPPLIHSFPFPLFSIFHFPIPFPSLIHYYPPYIFQYLIYFLNFPFFPLSPFPSLNLPHHCPLSSKPNPSIKKVFKKSIYLKIVNITWPNQRGDQKIQLNIKKANNRIKTPISNLSSTFLP